VRKSAMPRVVVKESKIHGRGLFAKEDIRAGEGILDWSGCSEALTPEGASSLPEDERKYLSFIDGQYVLFKPPARFVNHSCDPNARATKGRDVASRDIEEGEEITVDYVVERVPGLKLNCTCGSPRCRGVLTDLAQRG
jgi:SET domain-containing protein